MKKDKPLLEKWQTENFPPYLPDIEKALRNLKEDIANETIAEDPTPNKEYWRGYGYTMTVALSLIEKHFSKLKDEAKI